MKNKLIKFALAAVAVCAGSSLAFATLGTRDKLLISNSIKDAPLAAHIASLFGRDENKPNAITWTTPDNSQKVSNVYAFKAVMKDGTALGKVGGAAAGTVAQQSALFCYGSPSSTGVGLVTTAGTAAFFANTNSGGGISLVTGKAAYFTTTTAGVLWARLTQTSHTVVPEFLCCVLPDQTVSCSGSVQF